MMKSKNIIIIGGGIGGLATANLLAKAGHKVTIYEKNAQLGGRAGRRDIDGFRFDTGPSWYLMPEVFDHYYHLLGTSADEQLELVKLSPSYRVFFEDNSKVDITSDLDKDKQTFERIEGGSSKKLETYVARGSHLYDLSIRHFLYTNFDNMLDLLHPDVLQQLPNVAKYALTNIHSYVKTFFSNPKLQKIIEYPMVFLGTSPFQAPALYSLMSALDFKQGVYYPQNGMYTIIESLVTLGKKLGVSYHTAVDVSKITVHDGHASGIVVNGEHVLADIVISNADIHHTETALLAPEHQSFPARYWKKKDPGTSAFLMYLGVKGELPDLTHHNLLFVDAWRENFDAIYQDKTAPDPASIYLCKPSEVDPSTTKDGHENLFVLVPYPTDSPIDSPDEVADTYLAQVERMTGVHDLRQRIVSRTYFTPQEFGEMFNSWNNTALGVSHILRQSALFRTPNKSKKVKGLYYVGGNTVPGIGLPMCLIGAELVYKRIAGIEKGGMIDVIEEVDV